MRLHQSDLDRRGVGAQEHRLGRAQAEVERVPHASGRMGGRHVEGLEVVPVGLRLGTLGHRETHGHERVLELVPGLGDQIDVPDAAPDAGERGRRRAGHHLGQIEPLTVQPRPPVAFLPSLFQ